MFGEKECIKNVVVLFVISYCFSLKAIQNLLLRLFALVVKFLMIIKFMSNKRAKSTEKIGALFL